MANQYRNSKPVTSSRTRFAAAPMAELEFSTLEDKPRLLTTFNAGDIIPVYCAEVLPHDTFEISLDFITRQATLAVPVMGELVQDFYAFFVPNRVVNHSWKNVMGENTSATWSAPSVQLSSLYLATGRDVQIPVGSVADYYGLPTQGAIPARILSQMNDLRIRGYLECYNQYFRDQNYQPPIAYSKLNVYNGFLTEPGTTLSDRVNYIVGSDGSAPGGAIVKALYGDGGISTSESNILFHRLTSFSALGKPLKANKMHDYFTSVLPSPQKGQRVAVPVQGQLPIVAGRVFTDIGGDLRFKFSDNQDTQHTITAEGSGSLVGRVSNLSTTLDSIQGSNIVADLNAAGVAISVNDLRLSSAMQRVYEILGNGGSRYTEFINSFFGLEVDNPFDDIPTFLGHFRRDLDFFQTAQTSATPSASESGTPQGTLAAFGFTSKDGKLFTKTFNEHGYIHIFTVVRHKNVYGSMIDRDFFRLSMLDYYSYPLANIGEQPVYSRQINPFSGQVDGVFGYQEAWAEYRYEPDRVSGYMRSGINQSLDVWNYSDDFDEDLSFANGEWLKSNTEQVVSRSTALFDRDYPQFKLLVNFHIKKERALPVYSVPGADIF